MLTHSGSVTYRQTKTEALYLIGLRLGATLRQKSRSGGSNLQGNIRENGPRVRLSEGNAQ